MSMLESGFVTFDPVQLPGSDSGMLQGLRFAVKDIYDLAGHVSGLGNPQWRATHGPAEQSAAVVQALLDQGATLVGKTHTDELCYSIAGNNYHYGMAPNPRVPNATPGGSSSGSASVVAAGLVDFALGSDTGGSIRIPASYCGLFGIRTTWGLVPMTGVAPLAGSFDTVGWLAQSAKMLQRVGRCLLPETPPHSFTRARFVGDSLVLCPAELTVQASAFMQRSTGLQCGDPLHVGMLEPLLGLFKTVQAFEAWSHYGNWITQEKPFFGPGIKERFAFAATVTESDYRTARDELMAFRTAFRLSMVPDTLLVLPTAPGPAPGADADDAQIDAIRRSSMLLTVLAGACGLPQISIPGLEMAGGPVGVSIIGPAGSDRALLHYVAALFDEV